MRVNTSLGLCVPFAAGYRAFLSDAGLGRARLGGTALCVQYAMRRASSVERSVKGQHWQGCSLGGPPPSHNHVPPENKQQVLALRSPVPDSGLGSVISTARIAAQWVSSVILIPAARRAWI